MADMPSNFSDGAAYEELMGRWSRIVGETFLDWLSLPTGLRWLDVGCGTGSFTLAIQERCAPSAISAVDPSADQIAYASERPGASGIDFHQADALSLPFDEGAFDIAIMALVIFFLPDRKKGIAEMKRVVRPGGTVGTYMWDGPGRRVPRQPLYDALDGMGVTFRRPPGFLDSSSEALSNLFEITGLDQVATLSIDVEFSYESFDAYWASQTGLTNDVVRPIREMSEADVERLKTSLRDTLPTDSDGRIAYMARANAVKGTVPG